MFRPPAGLIYLRFESLVTFGSRDRVNPLSELIISCVKEVGQNQVGFLAPSQRGEYIDDQAKPCRSSAAAEMEVERTKSLQLSHACMSGSAT